MLRMQSELHPAPPMRQNEAIQFLFKTALSMPLCITVVLYYGIDYGLNPALSVIRIRE